MKRGLLLVALALLGLGASRCRQLTPSDPTPPGPKEPPITIPTAPPATPNPGPSIPPRDPPGEPNEPAPPSGDCPPEAWRGWAFYRADWSGGSCTGSGPCDAVNDSGGFPRGVRIAFDSTAHPQAGGPMPPGCHVVATTWSLAPAVPMKTQGNEPFAMQATFTAPGRYTVTSKGSPGAKAESDVVVIR